MGGHATPTRASHQLAGSEVLAVRGAAGATRRAMHEAQRAIDDEVLPRAARRGRAATSFRPDPAASDAGADLADELGRSFLEGAVSGEDQGQLAQGREELGFTELSAMEEGSDLENEGAEPELDEDRSMPRGPRRVRRPRPERRARH